MKIELLNKIFSETKSDVTIEFTTKSELKKQSHVTELKLAGFEAEQDSICFLHEKRALVCGVDSFSANDIRSAATVAIKTLKATKYKNASVAIDDKELIFAYVEGFVLGGYTYENYKSKKTGTALKKLSLVYTKEDYKDAIKIFGDAIIVADATCFTRDIVNTIPEELNPPSFADLAKKLAKENHLECTVLGEKELKKEKCHAMLAVGRASQHESQLMHLVYKPKNPKKVISLIGKGLTYDSGGLSLKPGTSMVTMKMDKAGACAVLGIMKAVSELKLDVEVHGFIGAVENMIGGNAYKPDDILTSRSGKTIEVRNTDAEGRLVLADVLDYAQEKVKADYMFDFATLTGACMVALGQYTTGMMGHSQTLMHHFYDLENNSGELIAHLPFNKHLEKQIKSELADVCNISNKPYGGAITAGLFLDKFILDKNKEKWLHFDIAGSAYTETPWDCNVYGGTGAGVRFMSAFLKSIK